MIKNLWVAQCDICGFTETAKDRPGQYNEIAHDIPDGWTRSAVNKEICICPKCRKKLDAPIVATRNGFGG